MSDNNFYPWDDPTTISDYDKETGVVVTLKLSEYEYKSIDCFARGMNRSRHGQIKQIVDDWLLNQISQLKKPCRPITSFRP